MPTASDGATEGTNEVSSEELTFDGDGATKKSVENAESAQEPTCMRHLWQWTMYRFMKVD